MSLTEHPGWASALASAQAEVVSVLLRDDTELRVGDKVVTGALPVARALCELTGAPGAQVTDLGADTAAITVRPSPGSEACTVLLAEFDGDDRITAVTVHRVPDAGLRAGIQPDNAVAAALLSGPARDLAEGISVRMFGQAKRVTKKWGNETWLHDDAHSFGFKVIRLHAGHRTSLQYHQEKDEVYFVLDGLARLHYKADDGTVATAPFVCGTVATVRPLAWHRVEAVTDVTLIEGSTYDDGSDNIRVEDDYGRPNGYIASEFEG